MRGGMRGLWISIAALTLMGCSAEDESTTELETLRDRVNSLEAELEALDGLRGEPGATGAQGERGEVGPAGAEGPEGPAGPTGAQGQAGPAGSTGAQGPAGPAGSEGPRGPTGSTGATGPAGPGGEVGATGARGPTGDAGPRGDIGPAGPRGERGPAAYAPGEEPTSPIIGELSFAAGTAGAVGPLTVRSFALVLSSTFGVLSSGSGTPPRMRAETLAVTVELDGQQLALFQAATGGTFWASGTLTFEAGLGLSSVSFGPTKVLRLSWDPARNGEQLHVVHLGLDTSAMTITPTVGAPTSWSFEQNSGTGTALTDRMRFAVGGAIADHMPARDLTATIETPLSLGGGGGGNRSRLGELTVNGALVGAWTAQWMLRMGSSLTWPHDPTQMPLVVATVEGGAPVALLEASCQLLPVRLDLRSEDGLLVQDVTFVAAVLRSSSYDGLGTATSSEWSFAGGGATSACEPISPP